MHWITTSIILILSSTVLYTSIRAIEKYNTPNYIKNLAMFGFAVIPIYLYNVGNGISSSLDVNTLGLFFLAALLLSWPATIASLKAIELSPNPGLPLIIGKSYVVYTTLFALFFLDGELSTVKALAIIGILGFTALITFSGNAKSNQHIAKNKKRVGLSIFTFFAWGNYALILTYFVQQGVPASTLNLYLLVFVALLLVGESVVKKQKYKPSHKNEIALLLTVGVSFTIFQTSMTYGFLVAPNPGYINAANIGSIAFVALFSALVFKDTLNLGKILGILGITGCLIVLFI